MYLRGQMRQGARRGLGGRRGQRSPERWWGTLEVNPRNQASARAVAGHGCIRKAAEGTGPAPAQVPGEGRRQLPFPRARPGRTASKAALLSGCSAGPCSRGPAKEEEQAAEAAVKCCGCPLFWSIPERFPHRFHGKAAWVLKKYSALQPLLSAVPAQSCKANDGTNLYLYVELRTSITVSKLTFNCYFKSSLTVWVALLLANQKLNAHWPLLALQAQPI